MATNSSRKTFIIWEFFTVGEGTKFTIFDECEAKVPRGVDSTKSFTTTNLVHHLTTEHQEIHVKYVERKANKEPKQPKEIRKRLLE